MAHHEPEKPLSREERIFKDNIRRGDDFFQIEIFRSAKAWYQKALVMNIDRDFVEAKIVECERLLKYEKRVFSILGMVVACILIVSYALFIR
jgi:hypothetical protein